MKPLLLLIALAISPLTHAVTFEKANKAGGQIVLTTRASNTCKAAMKVAYATNREGEVMFGCWAFIDERVWLTIDGLVNVHDPESFTKKGETPAKPVISRGM